jgi:hypothetical protein
VQHSLYLIFAHNPEESPKESHKKTFQPLKDVKKFASLYRQNQFNYSLLYVASLYLEPYNVRKYCCSILSGILFCWSPSIV